MSIGAYRWSRLQWCGVFTRLSRVKNCMIQLRKEQQGSTTLFKRFRKISLIRSRPSPLLRWKLTKPRSSINSFLILVAGRVSIPSINAIWKSINRLPPTKPKQETFGVLSRLKLHVLAQSTYTLSRVTWPSRKRSRLKETCLARNKRRHP